MDLEFDGFAAQGLRRYVRDVAEACGLGPDSSVVEPDRPMCAYLPVDGRLPLFPNQDLALWWHEENGWAAGLEVHSGVDLIPLCYLDGDLLPAPQAVARFLADFLAGTQPGQVVPPVRRRQEDLLTRLGGRSRLSADRGDPTLAAPTLRE
ncbi:MAG: DUF6292 family protein [Labedaea sp.]